MMKARIKNDGSPNQINLFTFGGLLCAVFFLMFLNPACTPRAFEKPNVASAPPSANDNELSDFERDFMTMKTADLKFIFVVRRTDGNAFDADDKKFLRTNLPVTNRIVLSDEEKAFIIGTNYAFPPDNLEILRTRFNVEDYSSK